MGRRPYQIDMCSGPLWNRLLLFALPLAASSVLQLLFNAADVVVVGRFAGKEALAAVGSNTSLINLTVNLFTGLSVGANVAVAHALGAGDRDLARRSVRTAMTLALGSGLFLTVFGLVMARQILGWMSSPGDVIGPASVYLRTYFLGMPGVMAYNFGAAVLRAAGDSRRPLWFLTTAGVVNVLLNLLFVVGFHMGTAGVGLATAISQYISGGLVLACLVRDRGSVHLDLRGLGLDWPALKEILWVGLPAGIQGILFGISNVTIQTALNSFDNAAMVAGASAAGSIDGFIYAVMNAFHQSAVSFISQNYGAGKTDRVDRTLALCLGYVALSGLVLGNLAYLFGRPLVGIYAPGEAEVARWAMVRMRYICQFYALCGLSDTLAGSLRGIGCSITPTVVSLAGICGLRLLWVAWVFPRSPSMDTLFLAYPVSFVVTGSLHVLTFFLVRRRSYARAEEKARRRAQENA